MKAGPFQFFQPTLETEPRRPPKERSLQVGDFFMTEVDQMLRCDAGTEFLIDVNGGALASQIGVHGDDRHSAADVLQIAQSDPQRKVKQNPANLVSTEFVHRAPDLGRALVNDA